MIVERQEKGETMNNFYAVYMYKKHTDSFDECLGVMCIMEGYAEAKTATQKLNDENTSETLYYRHEYVTMFSSAEEALDYFN